MSHLVNSIKYLVKPLYDLARVKYIRSKYRECSSPYKLNIDWDQYFYNRTSIINLLIAYNESASYLEIGCQNNKNFNSIIAKSKTGVDPISGGTHRLTSDDYFKLGDTGLFDVVFLDGLHTYEQVRRDLRNAIKVLKQDGWIVLHDMLPRDWTESLVPRISQTWTGDVWKVAFEIIHSKGIEFNIVKVDHGVGVLHIKNKDEVTIPDMIDELSTKNYNYFYENMGALPIVDYENARETILEIIMNSR